MRRLSLSLIAVAGLAGSAIAQNTGAVLTDNGATYRIGGSATATLNTSPTTTGAPTMDLFKPNQSTPDHVFNDWWWYRTAGGGAADTREFSMANATSRTLIGSNSVEYGYDIRSGGTGAVMLTGILSYTLTGQPNSIANAARVDQRWTLRNPNQFDVELNMFHYVDFDLVGTAGGDSATRTTPNERMFIIDGQKGADWWGVGATNYQVTAFATLRGLLTNTVINDFNNTGLPFGPGDFTGGFQWRLHVPAGGIVHILSSYALNDEAIPAPGALALLGLAGLAARRRR